MRLVHVSEEPDIKEFVPRIPYRNDVDQSKGLVWALTELQFLKFLTPRDCPRATYRPTETSTQEDIDRFFSSSSRYCVAIEHGWYERMSKTTLYVYKFDTTNFYFDDAAQFYVSDKTEIPVSVTKYDDLFGELFKRDIEVRILNNLWTLIESVRKSSLHFSLCRIGNALPKP